MHWNPAAQTGNTVLGASSTSPRYSRSLNGCRLLPIRIEQKWECLFPVGAFAGALVGIEEGVLVGMLVGAFVGFSVAELPLLLLILLLMSLLLLPALSLLCALASASKVTARIKIGNTISFATTML